MIMPVYNGEGFICQAIQSILDQSFRDLELIVVSEFNTSLASLKEVDGFHDPRLVHIRNEERLGLIASLNLGLRSAKGRYIARMDSDDVSLPQRLEMQVAFMNAHPEVGVLGTQVRYIDVDGTRGSKPRYFSHPDAVTWDMLFNSPIPHPSAMLRSDVVRMLGGYDPRAHLVEDYDLWIRAAKISTIMNLDSELVLIRKHGKNITVTKRDGQNRAASTLAHGEIELLLEHEITLEEVYHLRHPIKIPDGEAAMSAAGLLNDIYHNYESKRAISPQVLDEVKRDMVRKYSVLVALSLKQRWGVARDLLDKGNRGAGINRWAVGAEALARMTVFK